MFAAAEQPPAGGSLLVEEGLLQINLFQFSSFLSASNMHPYYPVQKKLCNACETAWNGTPTEGAEKRILLPLPADMPSPAW